MEFKFDSVAAQSCEVIESTMAVYADARSGFIVANRNFVLCKHVHVLVRPYIGVADLTPHTAARKVSYA